MKPLLALIISTALGGSAAADSPQIVDATAHEESGGWTFEVTIRHPDSGWDHYANAWEILAPDGTSLGLRELTHPHVDEQPFTRNLSGVKIPEGIRQVMIRARCNLTGWAMPRYEVKLR